MEPKNKIDISNPCQTEVEAEVERLKAAAIEVNAIEPGPGEVEFLSLSQDMADYVVWQFQIPGENNAINSVQAYSNPAVIDDLVLAGVFSPGQLWALDKRSGEVRWHRPLPPFVDDGLFTDGRFLVGTSHALHALDPADGSILWSFEPKPDCETIYSHPVAAAGRVFIGDRLGRLNALDIETGSVLWSHQPETGKRNDVNATAVVSGDLVISGNISGLVLACEQQTGKEIWRVRLPSDITEVTGIYKGKLIVSTPQSVYSLSIESGAILCCWEWSGQAVRSVAIADDVVCVATNNDEHLNSRSPLYITKNVLSYSEAWLVGIVEGKEQWRLPYPSYSRTRLRYDAQTRLLYEATTSGMGIVDPHAGTRKTVLNNSGEAHEFFEYDYTCLPAVDGVSLFVVGEAGLVVRLRMPE